jgi:putative ABC transport system substrate-binding protein
MFGLLLITAAGIAGAQPAGITPRIGWLATSAPGPFDKAFQQGLRELGYVEGQNMTIEWRWVKGDFAQLPTVAAELLRLKVHIVVASGTPAALAMQKLTTETPIVMVAGIDPVQARLVTSLARPGVNITGLTRIGPELAGKRLELLKEAFPQISRVAVLWHDASNPFTASQLKQLKAAATTLGVSVQSLELRGAVDLDSAFAAIAQHRAEAIVTIQDGFTIAQRPRIIALVAKSRLPGIYETRDWADVGGLMAYGASDSELYRRSAHFVDKILKGAKPANLPIERPTKFELVINLKTAKALGLTIPPFLLLRANQVIRIRLLNDERLSNFRLERAGWMPARSAGTLARVAGAVVWCCRRFSMGHSLREIEKDALGLSPEDRARLAVRLLSSLEESVDSPEEIEKLWIAEAERRFQELRDGLVQGIPAQDVFTELRKKKR